MDHEKPPAYEWAFVGAETCHYGAEHEARTCDCAWFKRASKLTDEEVARKYAIAIDHPLFGTARKLSDNRPDRVICVVPEVLCPHCTYEFTATYADLGGDDHDNEAPRRDISCPECERPIFIERLGHLRDPHDPEFDATVTLNTRSDHEE